MRFASSQRPSRCVRRPASRGDEAGRRTSPVRISEERVEVEVMSLPRLRRCEGYLILDGTIRDAVELLDLALARTRASRGRDERLTEEVTEILLDARERLLAVAGGGDASGTDGRIAKAGVDRERVPAGS